MAVRVVAAALCLAALGGGCVIREIREIHHQPTSGAQSASCAACNSAAPGSVLAESQPPAPMVEEPGQPPAQDYVWVDGYWHWDGAEWIWITGRWVPPMGEFVFVPPSYYASGTACVYVPGFWQRGPRSPYPIRDHRPISVRGHSHGKGHHSHRPRYGDHRGDKPTSPPGALGGKRGEGDEVVVTIPSRPRPEKVAPSRPPAPSPSSPAWRSPASAPPASAPARPPAPPPAHARPGTSSPARTAPPSSGPARVAPPSSPPPRAAPPPRPAPPAKAAPPSSPPPRPAAPPRPAQSAGGGSSKKK